MIARLPDSTNLGQNNAMNIFQGLLKCVAPTLLLISSVAHAATVGPSTAITWKEEPLPADADGLRLLCDGVNVWEGSAPPLLVADLGLVGSFTCGLVYYNAVGDGPSGGLVSGFPVSAAPGAAPAVFLIQIP